MIDINIFLKNSLESNEHVIHTQQFEQVPGSKVKTYITELYQLINYLGKRLLYVGDHRGVSMTIGITKIYKYKDYTKFNNLESLKKLIEANDYGILEYSIEFST